MRVLTLGKDDLGGVMERPGIDYGQALDTARQIIEAVKAQGDKAVLDYTEKYDKTRPKTLRVADEEIEEAHSRCDSKVIEALKQAHANIRSLHSIQYDKIVCEWSHDVADGVTVGERIAPIESVGCYIPGGLAPYPSTILMTVTPAKVAGVARVVAVSPPKNLTDTVLAACKIAGVDEVYRVGGAQAVAALAYGTQSIKPVAKIVGPGNKYVTAAKMLVYGKVDVDMPAGPSEVLVLADGSANPSYIAADVLAQAEHDPDAQCIVATDSAKVIDAVKAEVAAQSKTSEKVEIITKSLQNFTIIKTKSIADAIDFANDYAPEHLEIQTKNADDVAKKITNAGAVFIGSFSPTAAGDYASGGNHVLPTGGTAKYASPLSVRDYLKSTSIQKITRKGLEGLANTITTIAGEEGLLEHKRSVEKRLD